jgi:hypothetical protein
VQAAVPLYICNARRLGGEETVAEPEFFAQANSLGFLSEERIRPGVNDEAVHLFAQDDAAGSVASFEDEERHAAPRELVGGSQAGDSASNDDGVNRSRPHASHT